MALCNVHVVAIVASQRIMVSLSICRYNLVIGNLARRCLANRNSTAVLHNVMSQCSLAVTLEAEIDRVSHTCVHE